MNLPPLLRVALLACGAALLPSLAGGQVQVVNYISGTGFFVNRNGDVLTNAHVVRQCRDIYLRGAVRDAPATIVAVDAENDLALLKTNALPPNAAELRSDYFPPVKEENVVTVGFPGEGVLTTREARIVDPRGPQGEEKWLQFTDSVTQGNSGGPLLDVDAHVVGVVVAKAEVYRVNRDAGRNDLVRKVDIAITLPAVRHFLEAHRVPWRENTSGGILAAHRVEDRAKEFIVNVRCRQ